MLTSDSPKAVMLAAYHLGSRLLPQYSSKFSRHDFTLPQLFACLVLREQLGLSYRATQALLKDSGGWLEMLCMNRAPDHNTLCRAFHLIMTEAKINRMLDILGELLSREKVLGDTCAIDSTLYDTHHRSRHYEQRCRHHASSDKKAGNARRSASAKKTPKLSICVDVRTHIILAARTQTGMGSDASDFLPLLRDSKRRCKSIRTALADAGYDSHANHHAARTQLGIHTLIKTGGGRPSTKPPASCYRRTMKSELDGSQKGRPYGQRAQAETANSMLKRNLSSHLRARSPRARRNEQLLKVITHNLMIIRRRNRGSRQSRTQLVFQLSSRAPRCSQRSDAQLAKASDGCRGFGRVRNML